MFNAIQWQRIRVLKRKMQNILNELKDSHKSTAYSTGIDSHNIIHEENNFVENKINIPVHLLNEHLNWNISESLILIEPCSFL